MTLAYKRIGPIEDSKKISDAIFLSNRERKAHLGQFLTPPHVADFMAGLFSKHWTDIKLLDAGAGAGALTKALVCALCSSGHKPHQIHVTAYEIDQNLLPLLHKTFEECKTLCVRANIFFSASVLEEDFIQAAVPMIRDDLFFVESPDFNMAIVNPPYKKIRSDSQARLLLHSAGIEASNLYPAFLALIARLLVKGGELVAITPRSFCNGPYFKPFRAEFLETMSLRHIHVFDSRREAFKSEDVLQETVIVHAVKEAKKLSHVVISSSNGHSGNAIAERKVAYTDVVSPGDPNQFIHLMTTDEQTYAKSVICRLPATLDELGLIVSTGRVVDFRAKSYLRKQPGNGTVPLIYPCHFRDGFVHWPKVDSRKPNAIVCNEHTHDLLVPAGVYVLVKRFTSKEERRRVVACIYDPESISSPFVGFENHLNYYHIQGHGISMNLAKGMAAFLNSSLVDVYFRQFSGHTQVNASDLRTFRYPSVSTLEKLGNWYPKPGFSQEQLDKLVEGFLF
ncbi:MAG TPA: Eco57I restriction-modification methylase domain-containing protein [Candidatus Hydrogenedentes bacterium]|nr:Eco57I restriction-modification methylase domain-containing protein [Candidatus Hydrogenedentota bacterium]